MFLCLRFLDYDSNNIIIIWEEFVGFKYVEFVKGVVVINIIVNFLVEFGFDIGKIRV